MAGQKLDRSVHCIESSDENSMDLDKRGDRILHAERSAKKATDHQELPNPTHKCPSLITTVILCHNLVYHSEVSKFLPKQREKRCAD